ncbi:hypothetical protein J1N35_005661, partial [Gossypium stocksii]
DLNCSCELCADDKFIAWIDGMDHSALKSRKKKNRKKSTRSEFYRRWMEGDPNIRPLGEDNASYDKEFPPLEEYTEKNYTHAPKIPLKIQTDIS